MAYCQRHGVKLYPVFDMKLKGWVIEADLKGKIKRGTKVIEERLILKGETLKEPLDKAYEYYRNKLESVVPQGDNNTGPAHQVDQDA